MTFCPWHKCLYVLVYHQLSIDWFIGFMSLICLIGHLPSHHFISRKLQGTCKATVDFTNSHHLSTCVITAMKVVVEMNITWGVNAMQNVSSTERYISCRCCITSIFHCLLSSTVYGRWEARSRKLNVCYWAKILSKNAEQQCDRLLATR